MDRPPCRPPAHSLLRTGAFAALVVGLAGAAVALLPQGEAPCLTVAGGGCQPIAVPTVPAVCPAGYPAPQPANDHFANAVNVWSVPYTTSGNNACATMEPAETQPGLAVSKSVWYSWTPAANGIAAAHTCGSAIDTVLAAYDGPTASSPYIVSNDDAQIGPCAGSNLDSYIAFPCTAGTTYHLQVTRLGSGAGGAFSFGLSGCDGQPPACPGPANNCFANAQPVASVPFSTVQMTTNANTEAGEPAPCAPVGATVWFDWTPSTSGAVTIDTVGSPFDTVLAAHTGPNVWSLATVACNNDTGGLHSRITFACEAGVTYRIQAGGHSGAQGELHLKIGDCLPAPPPQCGYTVVRPAPYDYVDIMATGIPASSPGAADNDGYESQPLNLGAGPDFLFHFCGEDYTSAFLSSNGYVCFEDSNVSCNPSVWTAGLPDATYPRATIFGYAGNLNPEACGGGACVRFQVLGTAPSRTFIYAMEGVPVSWAYYPGVSFEVKLFEATPCFEVHYKSVQDASLFRPFLAGFQDQSGTRGYTYAFGKPGWTAAGTAWAACAFMAKDDAWTLNEDQAPQTLDVLANDLFDPPVPTIVAHTAPSLGTLTGPVGATFAYEPFQHATGTDSFTYTSQDIYGRTSTATVTLNLTPVNDAPSFVADRIRVVSTPTAGTVVVPGWARQVAAGPPGAADEGSQAISFEVVSNTNPGIFAAPPTLRRSPSASATEPVAPTSGAFAVLRFEPAGSWGEATVCFRARDSGGTGTATNSWGATATGVDASAPTAPCVDILQDAPPVAYFEPSSAQATPGQPVTFDPCPKPVPRCSHDSDGAIVQYLWEFGDGATSGLASPMHAFARTGLFDVRLTVWDDHGVRASVARTITIVWEDGGDVETPEAGFGSAPPLADAGPDRIVLEGARVQLAGAHKGGGPSTTFAWRQVGGPGVDLAMAATPAPTFTAPRLDGMEPLELVFGLRVADTGGEGASDYVAVRVVSANRPPVAAAGGAHEAFAGSLVALDGSATADADGDSLVYLWQQVPVAGQQMVLLSDASSPRPTFTAPAEPMVLRFVLSVTDGKAVTLDHAVVVVVPAEAPGPAAPEAPLARASPAMAKATSGIHLGAFLWAAPAFLLVAVVAAVAVVRRLRRS